MDTPQQAQQTQHFKNLLENAIEETGTQLKQGTAELAAYMSERTAHLAAVAHEPGFDQAVRAERNAIVLRAGLELSDQSRAVDQRIIGVIHGALALAAGALVG